MRARLNVTPGAGLLEDEAQPAQEVRVGGAVPRVGVVEHLLREVERTDLVQRLRPVPGHDLGQIGVDRLGEEGVPGAHRLRRLEEVGGVRPHLVVVGHEVRLPVMMEVDAGLRFRVDQGKPVPVQVEPVVVRPPPGPGLVVLPVQRVGHKGLGAVHVGPVGVPVPPVGVQHRLDVEDALLQDARHLGGRPGDQPVGREHGRLAGRRLVSVDPVPQVDDHRTLAPGAPPAAPGGVTGRWRPGAPCGSPPGGRGSRGS
jgi:hypothetical protein